MGWGVTFGFGWGGCDVDVTGEGVDEFSVFSARATSSKTYIVQFTKAPLILSPIGPNDAANLANVELVRLDTNEVIPLLAAGPIPGQPLLVEFLLVGTFASHLITYETRHVNLLGVFGETLIDPKTAQFDGMAQDQAPQERTQALVDYFNPQAEETLINGGLVVATNADYEFESGASLMRKLIIRRIVTAQDEFFHLSDREYGLGVQPKLIFTEADIVQFRAQLDREVRKEPEVVEARSQVTIRPDHELIVTVRARLRTTNQQIEISVPLDFSSQTTVIA